MSPWARERLERWRSRFRDDDRFRWRLAQAGLDEAALLRLLDAEPAAAGDPPGWWRALERAYREARAPKPRPPDPERDADASYGALRFARPLVVEAVDALARRAERHARDGALEDPRRTARALLEPLALELAELAVRTLVLELNVAALEAGEDPDPGAHAGAFFGGLEEPERALALLAEYPVLARLMADRMRLGRKAAGELLDRLVADWGDLTSAGLLPCAPLRLERCLRLGDCHDGARAVVALTFADGRRLVYKPRPLAMEAAYGELLRWLGDAGLRPAPATHPLLDRGAYGWQQAASHEPAADEEALGRFYERLGGQLAVVHALWGRDMHRDNLLAAGEHPLLVDLEALFHPRLGGAAAARVEPVTGESSPDAVTRVGLLPGADFGVGVDYSGLGAGGHVAVDVLEPGEAGLPRVVRRPTPASAGHHRPAGSMSAPWRHADDISRGFAAAYRLLLDRRRELVARGGPVRALAEAENRVVLRNSAVYAGLIWDALHPDNLRDALDGDRLLDGLWLAARSRPDLLPVVGAELEDLRLGDIPRFSSRPGSTTLRHHRAGAIEGAVGAGLAPDPEAALGRLGEADLERQLAFVRTALTTANPDAAAPARRLTPAATAPSAGALLSASAALADRLGVLALRGDGEAGWLAPRRVADGRLALVRSEDGLAEGVAGVAVFLAWHGELTGDERATALADEAAERLRGPAPAGPGLLTGAGGLVWALAQLGALREDSSLLERSLDLAREGHEALGSEESTAVADGVAGLAAGALALHALSPARAGRLGPLLASCAERLAASVSPAAGFAHGAAGTACVLLDLASVCADAAAREAGLALAASLPAAQGGSWLSGAAGHTVALARALVEEPTAARGATLRRAAEAAEREGLDGDHSLAHGALGALEALTAAALALGDRGLASRAARLTAAVAGEARRGRTLCATPGGIEHPGLHSGLAGVGLALLRRAAPERVPSPLWPSSAPGAWPPRQAGKSSA